MIEAHGRSSVAFESIREASEALTQMRVQALFLDIFVGQHNTLLHVPRFRALAPSAPIVLMTAGSSGEGIEATLKSARQTGADYVLRKPFTESAIAGILSDGDGQVAQAQRPRHVLIIDDSATVRAIAAQAYRAAGYRISEADSMETAFADVDIAHVDLVLCDIFMPGMGGFKGIRMLKATWPQVRIISMSAGLGPKLSEHDALTAALRIGADAQIKKPFAGEDLLEVSTLVLSEAC